MNEKRRKTLIQTVKRGKECKEMKGEETKCL